MSSNNTKVKVPKPVVLPSMRKEHNGYDPKLSLINKGNTNISVGATTTNYHNSSNTNGGEGKNKDDEDIVSKLRQNGGGWGQSSSSGGNNGVEQQKSSSGETSSSAGGNDTNFVKIVEVKPIQSTSQWGTNVIAGGSVGGEKNRDGKIQPVTI